MRFISCRLLTYDHLIIRYKRVYVPHCKVADTLFYIQGDVPLTYMLIILTYMLWFWRRGALGEACITLLNILTYLFGFWWRRSLGEACITLPLAARLLLVVPGLSLWTAGEHDIIMMITLHIAVTSLTGLVLMSRICAHGLTVLSSSVA